MRLVGIILAGLIAVTTRDTSAVRESNIFETAESVRLVTDDGLELELSRSDGSARSAVIGGRAFALNAPLIRFEEVIEDTQSPDLLQGGDWGMPGDTLEENANGYPGTWLRVSGDKDTRPRRRVEVNQTEPRPLILSGWCQVHVEGEAFGWWNRHLALNANVTYLDGERMPEVSGYFGQYDHGPQFNKRVICPDRPIKHLDLDLSVPGGKCTAWYRDVELRQASYRIASPLTPLERIDYSVHQEFAIEAASLRGLVTYLPKPDHVEIRCSFENTQPSDRAVSAHIAIPLDAVGGVWHDDVRTSRKIEAGKMYRGGIWYGAGRDGWNSRYPIACIETAEGQGLAIGTSVAEPRVFQAEYDAARRELRIRFDLGLSPDAGRWANRGSFTAYLFTFRDGFRGSAEKYHRMFAWAFENRVREQGIWLPFVTPLSVHDYQDFGFRFLESVGHMGWDETQGMYSLKYAETWIHHHELPSHIPAPEVHGPVVPQASVDLAKRIMASRDASMPLDIRRRYPAYLGSYIEDAWGNPQGYFFRGGRNENMMIVNPNHRLPSAPGADYSSGGWDDAGIRETMEITRQWHLPSWTLARVGDHPFLEVDTEQKASGRQSVRLEPAQGKSYFEQHYRGISQKMRYEGTGAGPFTFTCRVRGEQIPKEGTAFRWRVTFWYEDGKTSGDSFGLTDLTGDWQTVTHAAKAERPPRYVSLSLDTPPWTLDSTVLWVDDVTLTDGGANLLDNGGFEESELMPCRLDGVYLDTLECYECNLNYRRAHWPYAEEPLTFDCARRPALHQVYSHVSYARHIAKWMHGTGRITFGNCSPVTPFAAPYLDAMGGEQSWKQGDRWSPWPDSEFNFARFMSRGKPYCLLQYSDLTPEEQERYVKRCLFYGVFPSNQGAPGGGWYWANPIVVDRHRPVFAKHVPLITQVAEAGWEPVTLARTTDPEVWIERFGAGETLYFTVFNSGKVRKTVEVLPDQRCGITGRSKITNVITGRRADRTARGSWTFELDPEDTAVFRVESAAGKDTQS